MGGCTSEGYTVNLHLKAHLLVEVRWRFVIHGFLALNSHYYKEKPWTTLKLPGGSDYGASILLVPLFRFALPISRLAGKSKPTKTLNTNSSYNSSSIRSKLSKVTGLPKQCVIRWFSFPSVWVYLCILLIFSANRH